MTDAPWPLLVEIGPDRRYVIDRPTIIGHGSRCGIRLRDSYASREHALLRHTIHGWQVVDLASTNGTWLRTSADSRPERRVHEAMLGKGDRLRVGRTWLVVVPT